MIITLASFKGGVAKTTSAIHIACYLQQQGRNTLLIDSDPNRSALKWSERGELPVDVITQIQAPKFFGKYEDYVIDTQARPNQEDLAELVDGCDLLILPSTPDALALDALMQTVNNLQELRCNSYKILLTIVPPSPSRDGKNARDMLGGELGLPLFGADVRRFVAYKKAAEEGVPVYSSSVKDKNKSEAWKDYRGIGEEIEKWENLAF